MSVVLVPVFLLMFSIRETPRDGGKRVGAGVVAAWTQLWGFRSTVTPLILARVMVWIADGAVLIWGAPIFAREFRLPPDRVGGIVGSVLLIGGLLGPLLGGVVSDWCQRVGGPRRTFYAMALLALLSAPMATFALMPGATAAAIVLTVFITLGYGINIAAVALGTIVVPPPVRGLLVAVSVTGAATFCIGVAPVLVSTLSTWLGGPNPLSLSLTLVCGVTSLLGAAVFVFGARLFPARDGKSGEAMGFESYVDESI
jgi:MFS family permease